MAVKPYRHQDELIEFILKSKNALAWHEVGLGKTLAAMMSARVLLARIRGHADPLVRSVSPKALVVLPKGLVSQWRSEVQELAPDMTKHFIYVPYSQLKNTKVLTDYYDIRVIICDESHMLKTIKTQRIDLFGELLTRIASTSSAFKSGKIIFLTGTPIPNSAAEMYTTWAILGAHTLASAVERLKDNLKYNDWVASFTNRELKKIPKNKHTKARQGYGAPKGVANEDKLNALIAPFTHYRTAAQCLDLPDDQEILIDLGLTDDKLFENANIEHPEHYMAICEKLARAKTPYALEWIEDFLETNPGERLVVFCPYKWPLEQLQEKFGDKFVKITGEQSMDERHDAVTTYNSAETPVLGGTYQALSTGYNLQAGCKSLYLGYPWSPMTIRQAKGRTKRSGQKNRTLHFFLMSGGNDKKILKDLRSKEKGIQKVETKLITSAEELAEEVNSLM